METSTKNKARFLSDVRLTPRLESGQLRSWVQQNPEGFALKVHDLADSGKLSWRNVDLRDSFHELDGVPVPMIVDYCGKERAVQASAFTVLAGNLMIAGLNAAYEIYPSIGGELVTDMDDNKKFTHVVGITSLDSGSDKVLETQDFPEIGAGEERYTIGSWRNGRRLSITAEMIEENDTAGVLERVNALGEISAEYVEEQTLKRVCDFDGSAATPAEPYVLHLNGTAQALYVTSNAAPLTRLHASGSRYTNNALMDTTDLENMRQRLAGNLNSRGKRILMPVSEMVLLVPNALLSTASKILNSENEPGIFNEINNWGPRGRWRPKLLSSPKLDDLSPGAWYLGNFTKQFRRKWKLRMETVSLGMDTESFLKSRIAAQFRVAWDCEIGAVDYVWVAQSLSGTTTPKDD